MTKRLTRRFRHSGAVALSMLLVAASVPAFSFEGSYADRRAGRDSDIAIRRLPDGRYSVKASLAWQRCMGQFEGAGTVQGDTLVASKSDGGETCTLTIRNRSGKLAVTERNCLFFHGASCEFEGLYGPARRSR